MNTQKTKEDIIQHKKRAIRKINSLLESYLASDNPTLLKKVDLLSYWLEEYTSYIQYEDSFESNRLLRYKRGNVIRVNFGFNVGKELGGLHLAVVLDADNKRNADVITVIPLSSTEGKDVHERSVDLGLELHDKIFAQNKKMLDDANAAMSEVEASTQAITNIIELFNSQPLDKENTNKLLETQKILENFLAKKERIDKLLLILQRNTREIERLKLGSMAITNQITTISKQRIYVPKKSTDFLHGVSLSATTMDKISDKLKELYFH